MKSHWMVYTARAVATIWVMFWIWFGLGSGLAERLSFLGVLVHTAVPGLLFALLLLVAWRRERLGGVILLAIGLLLVAVYPMLFWFRRFVSLLPAMLPLALPPLLSGAMFLIHGRLNRPLATTRSL